MTNKIISVSIGSILRNEINKWIYPNKKYSRTTKIHKTISIAIPIELLEIIDSLAENSKRSVIVREFIMNYLSALNSTFDKSFLLFTSAGRFLNQSILNNIVDKVESKITKVECKNIYWIKLNGKNILKNDFTVMVLKDIIKEYETK